MIRDRVRRHPVICFLAVTYAVTWIPWLSVAASGHEVTRGLSMPYLVGLLGPLVGALATTAIASGRSGVRDLLGRMIRVRVGGPWWLVAVGAPLMVAGASYVVAVTYSIFLLAPTDLPTWSELGVFNGFPITNAMILWVMLVAVNGFGEETGWRGFLLPQLQRRWSPLVASVIVGVVWDRRAGGLLAAVETTAVMLFAAVLLVQELVAARRERQGRAARHVLAPS